MAVGSFLFLKEQIKDIIIWQMPAPPQSLHTRLRRLRSHFVRVMMMPLFVLSETKTSLRPYTHPLGTLHHGKKEAHVMMRPP